MQSNETGIALSDNPSSLNPIPTFVEFDILAGLGTPRRHGREWRWQMSPDAMLRVGQCRNIYSPVRSVLLQAADRELGPGRSEGMIYGQY
jgi:hypothetical protein